MRRWVTQVILPLGFLLLAIVVVLALTVGFGTLGARRNQQLLAALPTNPPPLPGTPIALFESVNPARIAAYEAGDSNFDDDSVLFNLDIEPLGAYLPRSGNRNFALEEPTAAPTAFPYPTTPPLIIPTFDPTNPAPTTAPDPLLQTDDQRTIPYLVDTDCAPAGNPVEGIPTQRYHRYHLGIDIGVRTGTPVIATHSGRVVYADWSPIGYGYLVILQSGAFITYYAHNSSFNVVPGQFVGKGSVLAWSGSTGNSSRPHVHYETRVNDVNVNPLTFEDRGYGTC